MKIKLLISYDGSPFGGWQKQNGGKPTIQGLLEEALEKIFKKPIPIKGSGRTDVGVHAIGQVAHFNVDYFPKTLQLTRALNSLTPKEILIKQAWEAPDEFHAIGSAEEKNYKYFILNTSTPSPFLYRYTTWYDKKLNLDALNEISSVLIGQHDFKSFQSSGTKVKTTIRTIKKAEWTLKKKNIVEFSIIGTGFLKQMVRNIVGTSLDLHKLGLNSTHMADILASRDRRQALSAAPAEGLYLYRVVYPRALDKKCRKI
jgi:tRNA pseudouridine38-40 synthase